MYYYESIFPKKDVHAFLVFVTHSNISQCAMMRYSLYAWEFLATSYSVNSQVTILTIEQV